MINVIILDDDSNPDESLDPPPSNIVQ